jgi:hypothetical protein
MLIATFLRKGRRRRRPQLDLCLLLSHHKWGRKVSLAAAFNFERVIICGGGGGKAPRRRRRSSSSRAEKLQAFLRLC